MGLHEAGLQSSDTCIFWQGFHPYQDFEVVNFPLKPESCSHPATWE